MNNLLQGLKRVWRAWTVLAHKIGNFQARVLLTIVYIVLGFPFGLIARLFGDTLRIKNRPAQWLDHPHEAQDMQWAHRQ